MSKQAVSVFRKLYDELQKANDSRKKVAKYEELQRFIRSLNEEDAHECLQEYLNAYGKNDDVVAIFIFSALITRKIDTISELDKLKRFKDEVNSDTLIGRQLDDISRNKSDPRYALLKSEVNIKIDKAINEIDKQPAKRVPVSLDLSKKNMLWQLKKSYVEHKGRPESLEDLLNYEPEWELPIPKTYLNLFEKWRNITKEEDIREALSYHRYLLSIRRYPYFKMLFELRWKIRQYKRDVDIELYLQVVSQLVADSGTIGRDQSPFDAEEKQFFLAPLRKTDYYHNFLNRFDILFKQQDGRFIENFDEVGLIHLLLQTLAKSRKTRLLPANEVPKVLTDLGKFKDEVDKVLRQNESDPQPGRDIEGAKGAEESIFIDSEYAIARGYCKVGQEISSAKGIFRIIGIQKYPGPGRSHGIKAILIEYPYDAPRVIFSMPYSDLKERMYEHSAREIAKSFEAFVSSITHIAMQVLGYSLSFFTGGLSALIVDVAWDKVIDKGVESGVISSKTGFVLTLALPTAGALGARLLDPASKKIVPRVLSAERGSAARGLEGKTLATTAEGEAAKGAGKSLAPMPNEPDLAPGMAGIKAESKAASPEPLAPHSPGKADPLSAEATEVKWPVDELALMRERKLAKAAEQSKKDLELIEVSELEQQRKLAVGDNGYFLPDTRMVGGKGTIGKGIVSTGKSVGAQPSIVVSTAKATPMKGGKFKLYWNKQELDAAEFVWREKGLLWRREAAIYLEKGGKIVKTDRRLDALLFDIDGKIQAVEWTTKRQLAEGVAKKAQLEYQRELFDMKYQGYTILAKPAGEEAYYNITNAIEHTEVYPHWRK